MELKTLSEAEAEIVRINGILQSTTAERDEALRLSSEKDAVIAGKDKEISEANARAHEFFLQIPMVANTEEKEEEETQEQTIEDFAKSLVK